MDISLLGGWFAVLLVAVGWRDRSWRWRAVPLIAGGALLGTLIAAYPGARWIGLTDPLPFSVWLWFGLGLAGLIVLVAGWRTARWWRRGTALVAAALAILVCANG